MGMYDNLIALQGSPQDVATVQNAINGKGGTAATAGAIWAGINSIGQMLPPGEARKWLTSNPSQIIQNIKELIAGRKYTTGDYRLAERYNDQILCAKDISQPEATDDMVAMAHIIFNMLFGVRISVEDDLNSLQNGVAAYKARPVSQGMSDSAIQRAVYLKQTYYPNSTYNVTCWDLSWFGKYPLVQPIPDYNLGQWYTGKLPGGGKAVNGLIPIDSGAVISQLNGANFDTSASYASKIAINATTLRKYAPYIMGALVLLVILYLLIFKKK